MRKKKTSNVKFYGVIALFIFVVSIVEVIKNAGIVKAYSQVIDKSHDSSALIALPIFSIAVVLIMAIPRKNL